MARRKSSPASGVEALRRSRKAPPPHQDPERESLLQDISAYQQRLVAQNDALVRAQAALEETRDRFIELYDFAPTGYLTLDAQGVIRHCNLTAASLLGRSKPSLEGIPLLGYVAAEDRALFLDFLRRCRTATGDTDVELTMHTGNGPRCIQMLCRPRLMGTGGAELWTSLFDVTERKSIERDRERLAREHVALVASLMSAQESERARLARDLHDDIGQELTALRLMLELLANERSSGGVSPTIARLHRSLESLDRRLHFVASSLRPAALDLGIAAALDDLIRQWSETFGVDVEFCGTGVLEGALAPEVETHLYRITQEALNNVSKHAGASRVTVLLERQNSDLVLEIRDDGCGFAVDASRNTGAGLGLLGMRERAQLIGARLTIASREGEGTLVAVRMSFALVPRPSNRQERP